MRLWHRDLIPKLPRQQLLGQHREVAALRGKGWGKRHATVNYVFSHPYSKLYAYHTLIMEEMVRRGYNVSVEWRASSYRGKVVGYDHSAFTSIVDVLGYPEHDSDYYSECIENLRGKGIDIS